MTPLQKDFDNVFKECGMEGIFLKDEIDDHWREIDEQIMELGKSYFNFRKTKYINTPHVNFQIASNTEFNALALKYDNNYYIGINSGTIVILQQLFFRMLSSPNILSEFGDISNEVTRKMVDAQHIDFKTLFLSLNDDDLVAPKNPIRQKLADHLCRQAFAFLLFHEDAHIIYGHLDLLEQLQISSIDVQLKTIKDGKFYQTLEMDADAYATNVIFEEALLMVSHKDKISEDPDICNFYKDNYTALKLLLFAIYSSFRVFGKNTIGLHDYSAYSHPPSGLRQFWFLATIETIITTFNLTEILALYPNLSVDVIIEVEKAFEEISEQGYNNDNFKSTLNEETLSYTNSIGRNWNNVRPLLEKFATSPLAPLWQD